MPLLTDSVISEGSSVQNQQMRSLFEQVESVMKNIRLKNGDFLYFSDKNSRIKISPYRMTMEMRFPNGIAQTGN